MEDENEEEVKYKGRGKAHRGDFHWRKGLGIGRKGAGERL